MSIRRAVAVALASTALLTALVTPAAGDHPEYTGHAELLELVEDWQARGAHVETAAVSREGRAIPLVRIGSGAATALVTAELHANEPSGTEAAVRLIELLLGNPAPTFREPGWPAITGKTTPARRAAAAQVVQRLLERVTVLVFPMLDPDGAEAAHRRDMQANSDYATRVTVQADAIEHAVTTYRPDLMVDLHGGPDEPLNIGLIEPQGVEPAIVEASRAAAAVLWRSADALDVGPVYFEEHPFDSFAGVDGDPFDSADEAYYASVGRGAPLTWESLQLEGIPTVYSETVGLQSRAPQIGIFEGASIQQLTTLAALLDLGGLFDGTLPHKQTAPSDAGSATMTVDLPRGATTLRAGIAWPWVSAPQDWSVRITDSAGQVVGQRLPDGTVAPYRRSRVLTVDGLAPGRYTITAGSTAPAAAGVLSAISWAPGGGPAVRGVLGPAGDVRLCLDGTSLFREAATSSDHTSYLAGPSCE